MRTCTVMLMTDGKRSVYAVMRGKMKGRSFDAHSAEIIGKYELQNFWPNGGMTVHDYKAMTAKHVTIEAPAVYWQA